MACQGPIWLVGKRCLGVGEAEMAILLYVFLFHVRLLVVVVFFLSVCTVQPVGRVGGVSGWPEDSVWKAQRGQSEVPLS